MPFVLVLRIHRHNSFTVMGYVLRNWKAKIGAASESEVGDVHDLLEDLRHHSCTSQTSGARFFDRLADLSVGPVRALVSGSCLASDLETVLPMFFEGDLQMSSWQTSFDIVGEDVLSSLESANTIVYHRPQVLDRDIGDPDPLRKLLTLPRRIESERLCRAQTRQSGHPLTERKPL